MDLERSLPTAYNAQLSKLSEVNFSQLRDLPEWGQIFSDFCLFVRPTNIEEETLFLSRVKEFLEIHCTLAVASSPVNKEQVERILAAQKNYCNKQQQNDKTRRVLEKAFGQDWAENYMTTVLFDQPE